MISLNYVAWCNTYGMTPDDVVKLLVRSLDGSHDYDTLDADLDVAVTAERVISGPGVILSLYYGADGEQTDAFRVHVEKIEPTS